MPVVSLVNGSPLFEDQLWATQKLKCAMSVYQKQTLPVQFLQFGVDTRGVIVPILRRGKDSFVKLPAPNKPIERKAKGASESR